MKINVVQWFSKEFTLDTTDMNFLGQGLGMRFTPIRILPSAHGTKAFRKQCSAWPRCSPVFKSLHFQLLDSPPFHHESHANSVHTKSVFIQLATHDAIFTHTVLPKMLFTTSWLSPSCSNHVNLCTTLKWKQWHIYGLTVWGKKLVL